MPIPEKKFILPEKTLLFSPMESLEIRKGQNFPHWHTSRKLQFITFRLADSLPKEILQKLKFEKEAFLQVNKQPWDETTTNDFYYFFNQKIENFLAAGHGSCILADEKNQQILLEVLFRGNAEKYQLHAFVIMPNHIHVLLETFGETRVAEIVKIWKGVSANRINRLRNSREKIWMPDYYDRIIRSEAHYNNVLEYIKNNRAHGAFHWFFGQM